MPQHTPGPWIIDDDKIGWIGLKRPDYAAPFIGLTHFMNPRRGFPQTENVNEEIQANARLIAAAPDMLAMLQSIRNTIANGHQVTQSLISNIDAVIAQATGKD